MRPLARKKVLIFGFLGAVGCLLGWTAGEGLLAAGLPAREDERAAPSLASRPVARPEPPKLDRPTATAPPAPKAPERPVRDAPKPAAPNPAAAAVAKRPAPPPLPPEFQQRVEAAGGKTGEIQLTLLWNNRNDLDLLCVDPNDELIFFQSKKALKGSGGHLDVDKNVAKTPLTNEPVENIYFPVGAPLGRYRVYVIHWSNNGDPDPTEFRLNALAEGQRVELKGKRSRGDLPSVSEKDEARAIAEFQRGLPAFEVHTFVLPGLRMAVPDVPLYPGVSNTFRIRLERDKRNTAPVRLTFGGESVGLTLPAAATIAEGRDEAEIEVAAAPGAAPGARTVRATAAGKYGKIEVEFRVTVEPPPPVVQLGVPDEIVLFPGGMNRFHVALARHNHDGPVTLTLAGDAPGVTLPEPVVVPGDKSEASFAVSAAPTAAAGPRALRLVAKGKHGETEEPCRVVVQIPPPALSIAAPKSVAIPPGTETTVTVLVARDWYDGSVKVVGACPDRGVMAWEATVPADRDSVEMKVTAFTGAKEGPTTLRLTAIGGAARAETETVLEIAVPPPPAPEPARSGPAWSWRLVLVIGLWTALLAVGLALALVVGQNRYLGRSWLSARQAAAVLAGGGLAGLVAGAIGQALFGLLARGGVLPEIGFLAGWLLLGGLLGRGLGFFIPNLHPWRAALAGAGGGALGATAFILISQQGDVYGRFVGAALLGGCIGLMVALVELAFRAAWLEVHYGEREVITVNLGPEPVKIGSDARACTVWARGAAPLALRFWVREGQVVCEDAANRTKGAVADGARRRAGAVEVVVRTGSGAGSKRPAPKPAARPEPLSLDDDLLPLPLPAASCRPARATNDDDYDSLPMPVSPPPAAPPKTASRPALPAVPPKPPAPSPTGSKPALPPVPPAAPATTVRATPTNPPGQTRAMNIPCPRCKEKLPLGSRKCPACGTSW